MAAVAAGNANVCFLHREWESAHSQPPVCVRPYSRCHWSPPISEKNVAHTGSDAAWPHLQNEWSRATQPSLHASHRQIPRTAFSQQQRHLSPAECARLTARHSHTRYASGLERPARLRPPRGARCRRGVPCGRTAVCASGRQSPVDAIPATGPGEAALASSYSNSATNGVERGQAHMNTSIAPWKHRDAGRVPASQNQVQNTQFSRSMSNASVSAIPTHFPLLTNTISRHTVQRASYQSKRAFEAPNCVVQPQRGASCCTSGGPPNSDLRMVTQPQINSSICNGTQMHDKCRPLEAKILASTKRILTVNPVVEQPLKCGETTVASSCGSGGVSASHFPQVMQEVPCEVH